MSQLLVLKERLQGVLQRVSHDRDQRPEFVDKSKGRGTEPAWVVFEREQMHEAVTKERAKLGKGPIPLKEIERVEQLAVGHTDYADKFALYCAELVLKEK